MENGRNFLFRTPAKRTTNELLNPFNPVLRHKKEWIVI